MSHNLNINEISNSIWQSHDILKHMGYEPVDESEIDSLYSNVWKLLVAMYEHDKDLSLEEITATLEQALEEIEIDKQIQIDKLELEFAKIAYRDAVESIALKMEEIVLQIAEAMLMIREKELKAFMKDLEIEQVKFDTAKLKQKVDILEAQLKIAQARFKKEEADLDVRKGEIEAEKVLLRKLITESEIQILDGRIAKKHMEKLLVDIASADLDIDTAQLQIRAVQELIAIEKLKFSLRLAELKVTHFETMYELINEALGALQEWQASQLQNEAMKQKLIRALTEIEMQSNYEDKITPLLDTLNQLSIELTKYLNYLEKLKQLQKEATTAENTAIATSIAADTTATKAYETKSKILGLMNAFLSKYYIVDSQEAGESLSHYIGTGK